jgi:RNA-directed DNA polymerase
MCPIAGGNWNNSSNAGVWTLNLNNAQGNSNDNVGFRADSTSPHGSKDRSGIKGDAFRREAQASAKSVCMGHSSRFDSVILESLAL